MDVFAMMGMSLGVLGFIFGASALGEVNKLKKMLEDQRGGTD